MRRALSESRSQATRRRAGEGGGIVGGSEHLLGRASSRLRIATTRTVGLREIRSDCWTSEGRIVGSRDGGGGRQSSSAITGTGGGAGSAVGTMGSSSTSTRIVGPDAVRSRA